MKKYCSFQFSILFLLTILSCSPQDKCPVDNNLIPMYGTEKKCGTQLIADQEFIETSIKQVGDRKKAAAFYVQKGWEYLNNQDDTTAIKRFNQAWLLDPTNAEVYAGFGSLMRVKYDLVQSVSFLEKAISLDPKNAKTYLSMAKTYIQLYSRSKETSKLDQAIAFLKKSAYFSPKDAETYAYLTETYLKLKEKDSANFYLKQTYALDSTYIDDEVKNQLKTIH